MIVNRIKSIKRYSVAVLGALVCSLPAVLPAQQVGIGEYAIPTINADPSGITTGPDRALWFTEYNSDKIGRIPTAATSVAEYTLPTAFSFPEGIAAGPDGALWFTENGGNKIGRITTSGAITEYPLPTPTRTPSGIIAGPDGALWFTEPGVNGIGRMTVTGALTEYTVPTLDSGPSVIAVGPDGALWFTEQSGDNIGRITTSGAFLEYPVPTPDSRPTGIAAGSDGALWFTELASYKIGRIATTGAILEYALAGLQFPSWITAGPDGALWFTASNEGDFGVIGRISTVGAVTSYSIAGFDGGAVQITTGPDGALWFTNPAYMLATIGQAVLATANLSATPDSGSFRSSTSFSGSSFRPDENIKIYASGVGSAVLATIAADTSGAFEVTVRQPQSPFGPRAFLGEGQSSRKVGVASFTVGPRLMLQPASGVPGSTATVQGYGFGAMEPVSVYWNNSFSLLLGLATADIHGSFTGAAAITFTVPAGSPPGPDTLVGRGKLTLADGKAVFTVE
jgi:virginiamycin B lyase